MFYTGQDISELDLDAAIEEGCIVNPTKTINGTVLRVLSAKMSDRAALESGVRFIRDRLLKNTDFTQGKDCPLDETTVESYKKYREYLRGIPQSKDFPYVTVKTYKEWSK